MNEVVTLIQTVGFPGFVAIWMLVKDQREKEQTREALNLLTLAVTELKVAIEKEDAA